MLPWELEGRGCPRSYSHLHHKHPTPTDDNGEKPGLSVVTGAGGPQLAKMSDNRTITRAGMHHRDL